MLGVQIPEFPVSGAPQKQIVAVVVHPRHEREQLSPFPLHFLQIHVGAELHPLHPFLLRKFEPQRTGFQVIHQFDGQLVGGQLAGFFLLAVQIFRLQGSQIVGHFLVFVADRHRVGAVSVFVREGNVRPVLKEPAHHGEIVGAGRLGNRRGGIRIDHVRQMVVDVCAFFQKQLSQGEVSLRRGSPEGLAAVLGHGDAGLFQNGNVLGAVAPADFLEKPPLVGFVQLLGLFDKEFHHFGAAAADHSEGERLFLRLFRVGAPLQQIPNHGRVIPKDGDFQRHELGVPADPDRGVEVQSALEHGLQFGKIAVINGHSRFRQGLPTADVSNFVHFRHLLSFSLIGRMIPP